MSAEGLIDTGAILALLNREDRWYDRCRASLGQLPLPLMTSEAVLAEVFHLAPRQRASLDATWRLIRSGMFNVATIHHSELPEIQTLMVRYRDLPIDFADATLVHLARREGRSTILTIDRDFETYRIEGRRRFRIYPTK